MDKRKNILAVGAHPDDVELGCGGTISKHLELGDEVYVLIMTNGEKGSHAPNREECFKSLEKLGIKKENIFFGNFPDGSLSDNQLVVSLIESYLEKFSIDRIYTHFHNDRHQDHRYCSFAVSSAARKFPEIFLFQGPSTKSFFEPHYFIALNESHLKKKLDALYCYQSQISKGIVNIQWVESLASFHGLLHDAKYAEAFAINHVLRKENEV